MTPAHAANTGKTAAGNARAPLIARLTSLFGTVFLIVLILTSGFLVCAVPPQTTAFLSVRTSIVDTSLGFTRDNLVSIACATRDYAFGSHDRLALQQTIYDVNEAARHHAPQAIDRLGAPRLEGVDRSDVAQLDAAFDAASERFCYSADAITHLDDCYTLAIGAYAVTAFALVAFVVCMAFAPSNRARGRAIARAGWITVAVFACLGAWAAINFNGLFTAFHQLFFAQGNWTFAANSLLICTLPTDFWMGMGLIWLATSAIASILSILVGNTLKHSLR